MAAVRLANQNLPCQKENTNPHGKAFEISSRPRAAFRDIRNETTLRCNQQKIGNVKKTQARSKALSLFPTAANLAKNEKSEHFDLGDVRDVLTDSLLPSEVEDIDREDFDNPQLCAEYVNEIMRFLRGMERKYSVSPNYMDSQTEVTCKMRAILVDWLIQVHTRFQLLQETLYLTISIMDRFLANHRVPKRKLQLVGVSAMLLASKYEEMYAPMVEDFVYITDNAYTKQQVRDMEALIFRTLEFNLGKPLCLHFLRRNSKAAGVGIEKHTLAKYFMELTLMDYESLEFLPSEIAAAALYLSIKLLDNSEWNKTLEYYTTYTEKHLTSCVRRIAKLAMRAKNKESKEEAVYKKYSSGRFIKITSLPCLNSSTLVHLSH